MTVVMDPPLALNPWWGLHVPIAGVASVDALVNADRRLARWSDADA